MTNADLFLLMGTIYIARTTHPVVATLAGVVLIAISVWVR